MKRTFKNFDLCVWKSKDSELAVVKVKGRDIYDAYRKASEKYYMVFRPYRWKNKWDRIQSNRRCRRKGIMHNRSRKAEVTHSWVGTSKGVVYWD
jgi:hypothetical protein